MVGEIIGGRANIVRALTERRCAVTPGIGTVPRHRDARRRAAPGVKTPGMPERTRAKVVTADPVALASVKEASA